MTQDRGAWLLHRFRELRIAVIGDLVVDSFIECTPSDLRGGRYAPVVRRERELTLPGAAANVAVNAAALGARVSLVGVVGRDDSGARLLQQLTAAGVEVDHVLRSDGGVTHRRTCLLAGGHCLVRVDEGDATAEVQALRRSAARALAGADVVLISDHDLGVLHDGLIGDLCALRSSRPIVVEPVRAERYRSLAPTVMAATLGQARAVAGADLRLDRLARRVRHRTAAATVVVTVSGHGAYLLSDEVPGELLPADPSFAASEADAGDSFAATLALAIGAGAGARQALTVAMEAAAVGTRERYRPVVTAADLEAMLASRWDTSGERAGGAVLVPLSAVSELRPRRTASARANSGTRGGERSSNQSTETTDSPPRPLRPRRRAGGRDRRQAPC